MQYNGKDTSPHLRDGLRIEIGFGLLSKHLSEASYRIHKKNTDNQHIWQKGFW